jgi:putative tryptophan/tyrosine transport system substrate-binding protein
MLGLGGAVAWPLATRAQQAAPIVGFLSGRSADESAALVDAFRQGLRESGFPPGTNLAIEFRWADGQYDRLPALAKELIDRRVAAIAAVGGSVSGLAAKAATSTIPIVFSSGGDAVKLGLVASLNRPGGNVTGVSFFDIPLAGKRLGLLQELVPPSVRIALLTDPSSVSETELGVLEASAQASGRSIVVIKATNEEEIDRSFATITGSGAGALVVGGGPVFLRHRRQLVARVGRLAIPAIYVLREFVEVGGLMSYGASQTDAYRRVGSFVSRILKGEKPADMPVELPTRFELVLNLATAKALGLSIPPGVLAIADEVIE